MSKSFDISRGNTSTSTYRAEPFVLVGIPAYNEVATIAEVVKEAQSHANEVLVVDDGSTDGTVNRARKEGATVISHHRNQGYGSSLRTIFQYADDRGVDHLVILDADGQHDVGDVPDFVETQQETGAQLVTGSRFTGKSSTDFPRYRRVGIAVINFLTNLSLRVGYSSPTVSDSQCGFRAYDREAIEAMANTERIDSGMGASIDILLQSAREDLDITEVPTRIDYNVEDANTQNPIVHGLSLLKSLFQSVLRDRPLRMVSAGGGLLLVVIALVYTLAQTGLTSVYIMVIVLLTIGTVLRFTLSRTTARRSDSSER